MIEEREVTLHGHRVRYLAAGDGPVVVLVHGITSSADNWRPVIGGLAESHTVIAPDLLGHGASAKPRGDYSLGAYASGVRDLLAVLGHDHVTVVGHSLGGGVAMQFAYQFPERTGRLVLVSSGGLGREVSIFLRAAALPGAELVLPFLAPRWLGWVAAAASPFLLVQAFGLGGVVANFGLALDLVGFLLLLIFVLASSVIGLTRRFVTAPTT